jgi:hypothetical protein
LSSDVFFNPYKKFSEIYKKFKMSQTQYNLKLQILYFSPTRSTCNCPARHETKKNPRGVYLPSSGEESEQKRNIEGEILFFDSIAEGCQGHVLNTTPYTRIFAQSKSLKRKRDVSNYSPKNSKKFKINK